MDDKKLQTTQVNIFGNDYVLSSNESDAYTQEIAAYVDRNMKNVANEMNLGDTAKIAIMASFEIANQLLMQRSHQKAEQLRADEALLRLGKYLDGVPKDGEAA
jgi:cell division protein ZapA (FtsZ GTPase activity inhibitor)